MSRKFVKIFLFYIRPTFEYACEVLENCCILYSNKLEAYHVETARIISGLPVFTCSAFVYQDRRQSITLQMFYTNYHWFVLRYSVFSNVYSAEFNTRLPI